MSGRRKHSGERSDPSTGGKSVRLETPSKADDGDEPATLVARHLRFGWRSLFFFLLLGLVLEGLHGFKIGWYLDLANSTRRHMWTLAHAHGTLLAVLNLIFAQSLRHVPHWPRRSLAITSACLLSSAILLPAGFLLGGLFIHEGDPGMGIVLVPVGAVLLLLAVFLAARN